MPTLQIHVLGDFRIIYDGEPVTSVNQMRLQSLLAYLLLHRDAPQSRQQLAFLFWPDTSERQARTNLRQLLHHLHRDLPVADLFLNIAAKTLQWLPDAPCSLDIAEFVDYLARADQAVRVGRTAEARAALEAAINLYRGDLLPGCYDEWILPERERLHQAYIGALERLLLLTEEQRDYRPAIGYAERLLRQDPLHETTYRRLMRLHALCGDRASALRVYHTCATMLERELGVEPNTDTQEAYRRLMNMEAPAVLHVRPPSVPAGRSTLIGRDAEWNMLRSAWRHAVAGHTSLALISGEAGIGKTRLAEDLLEWAGQQGITSARTRCYATEGLLAYAPVTEWLRTDPLRTRLAQLDDIWLTDLARLLPELLVERRDLPKPEPLTDAWQRRRLFEALARAVLVDKGPLLLLLDDVQWCDQDTLDWIQYLVHFDPTAKLLVLGAARPEEVDHAHPLTPLLLELRSRDQVTEIELEPLDADETTILAEQAAGRQLDSDEAARLHVYTEGNPLFVLETVRAGVSLGDEERRIGDTESGRSRMLPKTSIARHLHSSPTLPPKVYTVIEARLRHLSPPARELASLAATIGRAFTFNVLAKASESDEETLVCGLDELWQRRIVREQGSTSYDFSHDRIREVAYAKISAARRQLLHRRAARALEQCYAATLDAVSSQIAIHFERAGMAEQAIAYYRRAAAVAQQTFSNAEVISLNTRALALLPILPDNPERAETELDLLAVLGTALMWSKGYGHPEVEQTLIRAWNLCRTLSGHAQTIPVLAGLWVCYHLRGDLAQEAFWVEHLKHEVEAAPDARFLPIAHFALAGTSIFRGDLLAAQQYTERGFAHYDPQQHASLSFLFGYEPGIAILPYWSHSLWLLGYPDQAREHMQRALALATASAQPATIAFVLSMTTVLHQWCGEVALTQDQAATTIAFAAEKGMPQWIAHNHILHGWTLAHNGQVRAGIDQIKQALMAWQASGAKLAMTYYLLLLAEAYALAGQLDDGLNTVTQALTSVHGGGECWMEAELHRRRGELLLARGADETEVEACFQRALETARLQHARSFELRAAVSMSLLWQQQGKQAAAHQLLAEIYGWFSEGFDTADVQQAGTLLEELERLERL
jgi:predicted ATPase/DNA-binding SARP family transcriptional activator